MRPGALGAASLSIAREQTPGGVCARLTGVVAAQEGAALGRVWTARLDRPELELVASAGAALDGTPWQRTDGTFARLPLGVGKIGKVAASAAGMLLHDMSDRSSWIAHPDWAHREGIRSFAALPLVHGGAVLGVVAVFSRSRIDADAFGWLRSVADHAAAAFATTGALAEAERRAARLAAEVACLRTDVAAARGDGVLVAESPAMRALLAQIAMVAPTDAPVLVHGERGAGKELVARRLHAESRRADSPFVRVPPSALADALPRFAAADGGTAFLDDIAGAPVPLQLHVARLVDLRTRADPELPDVRVVASTRGDATIAGGLHPELVARLAVCRLEVPPLRERSADAPRLLAELVARACERIGREPLGFGAHDLRMVQGHAWPGNVRELAAAIEHAVSRARGGRLRLDVDDADAARAAGIVRATDWRRRERTNLEIALARTGGRIYGAGGAAALLGIPPTTLASRVKALGITPPRTR